MVLLAHIDASDVKDAVEALEALAGATPKIVAAVTLIGGALTPVYTMIRSWRSASPEQQEASVALRNDRMVVEIAPGTGTEAARQAASLPAIKSVITNPEIAAVVPSDKVVAPERP